MAKKEIITKTNISKIGRIKSKRNIVIALIVIAVIALILFLNNQLVAATVNGEPIYRLTLISELEKQSGKQVLDQLITQQLILQEAQRKNINVSQKDIDNQIQTISENLKKNGQDLNQVLTYQGMSMDTFIEQTKLNIILTRLVGNVVITDKQINDYIKSNEKTIPKGTKPADLKNQVKQQLGQQKLQQKVQDLITSLRNKAKINYILKFQP